MPDQDVSAFEFGDFRLDVAERHLYRDSEEIPLTAKAFDTLLLLVRSGGRTIPKDEFMREVWPGVVVEESNLSDNIYTLRQLLGDDAREPRFIRTVPKRGYRFVSDVRAVGTVPSAEKTRARKRSTAVMVAALLLVLTIVAAAIAVTRSRKDPPVPDSGDSVRTLAVLPFRSLHGQPTDEQLGLGLTDALITRLGNIERVIVRPTAAIVKYRDAPNAGDVGRELNVDAILNGALQRSGSRLRLSVQLVQTSDQRTLWAATFEESLSDLFALEDVISKKVAGALTIQLDALERKKLERRYTESAEAYMRYLEGRYLWSQHTRESLERSIDSFEQAIALDADFALAFAGLASSYNALGLWQYRSPAEAYTLAETAATRAIALDPSLAAAHAALGHIRLRHHWNAVAAEQDLLRAVAVSPRDFSGRLALGEALVVAGRFKEGFAELDRAATLDPLSTQPKFWRAAGLYFGRNYDEAIRELQDIVRVEPDSSMAYGLLWASYRERGLHDASVEARLTDLRLNGQDERSLNELRDTYLKAGLEAYRRAEIRLLESADNLSYDTTIFIAMNHAVLLERDAAFAALERAFRQRSAWLIELEVDPVWDSLRSDPRFSTLVARVKTESSREGNRAPA